MNTQIQDVAGITGGAMLAWFEMHPALQSIWRRTAPRASGFQFNWMVRVKDSQGTGLMYLRLFEDYGAATDIAYFLRRWTSDTTRLRGAFEDDRPDLYAAFTLVAERDKLSDLTTVVDKGELNRCSKCGSDNEDSEGCWRTGKGGAFLCNDCEDPGACCDSCGCSLLTTGEVEETGNCAECHLAAQPTIGAVATSPSRLRLAVPKKLPNKKYDPRPGIDDQGGFSSATWED